MYVLGISAFYHDSAACIIRDGRIIAAAQEERFSRKKHDQSFPKAAIAYCFSVAEISAKDISIIAFYDKPFLKFERILESYLSSAPFGIRSFLKAMPLWIKQKLWMKEMISKELNYHGKIIFPEHHESHAASAFFPSPFSEAAFLTMDGVGEWATVSFGVGKDNKIQILADIQFPHSLGLLYSAFTYYLGFKINDGEYKLMGLAPYGEPKYKDLILEKLIKVKEDGSFIMDMKYFNYVAGLTMTSRKFHKLFGSEPLKSSANPTQREMDIARSIQEVTEDIILKVVQHVHKVTKKKYLCLAGGVALNCVANGRILRECPFDNVWIQPAAGDAGGALGAAFFAWHHYLGKPRAVNGEMDLMNGSYLGPEYSDDQIKIFLVKNCISFEEILKNDIARRVSKLISEGKIVGWFEGRMEFGPRALGARSIIADARNSEMQSILNLKTKFRESFRPFAPAVLEEQAAEYFEIDRPSPYMLLVAKVSKVHRRTPQESEEKLFGLEKLKVVRSDIPSVTHVDYSARIQTVSKQTNPLFYELISEFGKVYGTPVIINTSFNVSDEPIVLSPEDAYNCFIKTKMDYLVMGSFLISK